MPNEYSVKLPVAGYICMDVTADYEEEAIEKALKKDWRLEDVQELNAYKNLVQDNVIYCDVWEADAQVVGEAKEGGEDE